MLQIKMKALHYSCWIKMSTLLMCENTVSLFFSISAQGMAPSGMQFRAEKKIQWLVKYILCSSLAQIKERIFTVVGTFIGLSPKDTERYTYMPSGLKPDEIGFCRIRRLLGSCRDEPGRFRDPDWKGASLSMSVCEASTSVGSAGRTVTFVPVCWINCWRLTCRSSLVNCSSSCSLS